MSTRLKIIGVAITGMLMALLVNASPAHAAYPTSPSIVYFGDDYCAAQGNNGSCVWGTQGVLFVAYSSNGRDKLSFGASGNFAGYDSAGRNWFTAGTTGVGTQLELQHDCNVVVYDSAHRARWSAGSQVGQAMKQCRLTMSGSGQFSVWEYTSSIGWSRIRTWGNGA